MAPIKTNNPYASYFDFFSRSGTDASSAAPPGVAPAGLIATGGIISDYEDSGTYYRAHIFTTSGSLVVSQAITVDILAVGGGGGSGRASGNGNFAGAGAGGMLTQTGVSLPGSVTCPITIGAGGADFGSTSSAGNYGGNGVDTAFTIPTGPTVYTAAGGGAGGGADASNGRPGGSGSGGGSGSPAGTGSQYGPTSPLNPGPAPGQGNPGGTGSPGDNGAAGGGGAGASGSNGPAGNGGNGAPNVYAYGPASPVTYAGGGGGGVENGTTSGGTGGGGSGGGPAASNAQNGTAGLGGGGAGGRKSGGDSTPGGSGGSGTIVVRYQIPSSAGSAKATGGAISYYGGKTIHAFTSTGTFTAPNTFNETVEYVVVGGGGAGGGPSAPGVNSYYGGGGGAGAYRKGSTPISTPQTIAIQVGAGGAKGAIIPVAGSPSYFGTPITAPGGGYGSTWQDPGGQPTVAGGPGASSGGSSYGGSVQPSTGAAFSPTDASANTPTNGWGHPGGTGHPTGDSGGGGGAGGAGQNAADSAAGDGGFGMQLPTTFRDPASSVGAPGPTNTSSHNPGWTNVDNSGKFWIAGGGGGSAYGPDAGHTSGVGGVGTPAAGSSPYAGAGNGSRFFAGGTAALQNTGSGGGGMERAPGAPAPQPDAGNGGSGLVLIAYPT